MLRLSADSDKIENVEIVTNGTILPSPELLAAAKEYKHKIWFHLSNYSKNKALKDRLKYEQIAALFKENGVKFQMSSDLWWSRDSAWEEQKYSMTTLKAIYADCWFKGCVQVLNGKITTCPRASSGYQLGLIVPPANDFVELRNRCAGNDTKALRQELIDFYHKDSFFACRFCSHDENQVIPAIQI
jgi:hypothetical protein